MYPLTSYISFSRMTPRCHDCGSVMCTCLFYYCCSKYHESAHSLEIVSRFPMNEHLCTHVNLKRTVLLFCRHLVRACCKLSITLDLIREDGSDETENLSEA